MTFSQKFLIAVLLVPAQSMAGLGYMYVAPNGSDANPGTINSPFQTIDRAKQAVADFNRVSPNTWIVYIRGGTYFLDHPLSFGPGDSAPSGNEVIYAGYPGETPILSGGVEIHNWSPTPDGKWKAHVGSMYFRHLYVNGTPAIRARTPNVSNPTLPFAGPFHHLAGAKSTFEANYKHPDTAWKGFFSNPSHPMVEISPADAKIIAAQLPSGIGNSRSKVEFYVQRQWKHDMMQVSAFNYDGNASHPGLLTFDPGVDSTQAALTGLGNILMRYNRQAFHLENAYGFLDAPGEWFLDESAGDVFYIPRPGEVMNSVSVVAPRLETLLSIEGAIGNPVHHITFQGIEFEHTDWFALGQTGLAGMQGGVFARGSNQLATYTAPAAIMIKSAQNITFNSDAFLNLGGNGLTLDSGTQSNIIQNSIFTNIAANGITVDEALAHRTPTRAANSPNPDLGDCVGDVIRNNYILVTGRDQYGSVGIFAGFAHNLSITNNEIGFAPYSGISLGWGWSTTPTGTGGNRVVSNKIHDVMMQLMDGGAIYTIGNQGGPSGKESTDIVYNSISNVVKGGDAGYVGPASVPTAGVYLDQGSSSIRVNQNSLTNVPKAFNQNGPNLRLQLSNPFLSGALRQRVIDEAGPK